MNGQLENRRVRMTKRLMKDALLELLEQSDLSNISVMALCQTADVHRSTFYKYYTCPAELLQEIEQDVLDRIPSASPLLNRQDEEDLIGATASFFDYARENQQAFRVLFSESANAGFSCRLVDLLCKQMASVTENGDDPSSMFVLNYIANGSIGMLRAWLNSGFPLSSREMGEMIVSFSRKLTNQSFPSVS